MRVISRETTLDYGKSSPSKGDHLGCEAVIPLEPAR